MMKLWQLVFLSSALSLLSCSEHRHLRDSGFIIDREKMREAFESEQAIYQIGKADSIAEIGFGTGWMTGFMMAEYDSITIFAEDIDRRSIRNLPRIIDQYCVGRNEATYNHIHIIKGTEKSTLLPNIVANKVIIRETFHHFSEPRAMMADIYRITKSGGQIFVYEQSSDSTYISTWDGSTIYSAKDLIEITESAGFHFLAKHELMGNPGNVPPWWEVSGEHVVLKTIYVFQK
jgi:predicted methyltransferase